MTLTPLHIEPISPAAFAPFGQQILPTADGKPYDRTDAQLDLSQGIPRFYIMRLTQRGRQFHRMTYHQRCTQCLGSLHGQPWLLAVAPPAPHPDPHAIRAFQISGDCFVKLHQGTWHAGPYFDADVVDFYNLELSDTNITDHVTYDLSEHHGLTFDLVE